MMGAQQKIPERKQKAQRSVSFLDTAQGKRLGTDVQLCRDTHRTQETGDDRECFHLATG